MENTIVYQNKKLRKDKKDFAIFDVDWTLIKPREGRRFPKTADDWQWFSENVPIVIRRWYRKGYRIVLITDQTKPWKVDMIKAVIEEIGVPVTALISMHKSVHKPNPIFFNSVFPEGSFDTEKSFYVGDAAGRAGDWADVDKAIAEKLKLSFYTPEEAFMEQSLK